MIDNLEKYSSILITAGILIEALITFLVINHYGKIKKKTLYSYKNASFLGGSIFLVAMLMYSVGMAIRNINSEFRLLNYVTGITGIFGFFPVLMLPFTLLFFFFMGISNLSLLRHEGKSIRNIVGSFLGFAMLIGTIALFFGWDIIYEKIILEIYATGYQWISIVDKLIPSFLSGLLSYLECLLLGTIILSVKATKVKPDKDKDYVIILGCAISKEGKPLPLLRGRIDRAIRFAKEQYESTGKKIKFVPSGGKGDDECVSEADSMKEYLISQGIAEDDIIPENKSSTTLENMRFSKALIEADNGGNNIIYSTTNYHVFRSGIYAQQVGLNAQGIGSKTKWYFWPNAFVREFVALIVNSRKGIAINTALLFFICLISAYVGFILIG